MHTEAHGLPVTNVEFTAPKTRVETSPNTPPIKSNESGDPKDIERVGKVFDETILFVGMADENRAMVDREYCDPERIAKDLGVDKTDPTVNGEQRKRELKKKNAQTLDKDKIAQQLVDKRTKDRLDELNQENKTKDPQAVELTTLPADELAKLPDSSSEEMQLKAVAEGKRRKDLMNTYDILYTIRDAENAYKSAFAERQKAVQTKLDELNKENKTKDPQAVELTSLPADELAKLPEPKKTDYYDSEQRTYNRLDKDGKTPLKDQTVKEEDTYLSLVQETERLSKEGTPEQQTKGKELLSQLNYNSEENRFTVLTKEAAAKKELKEQSDEKFLLATSVVEDLGESLGASIQKDNGDLDPDKLKNATQESLDQLARTGSLGYWVGVYNELRTKPGAEQQRDNVATLLHLKLKGIDSAKITNPELRAKVDKMKQQNGDPIFDARTSALITKINDEHLIPRGIKPGSIKKEDIPDVLMFSAICENHLQITVEHGQRQVDLPKAVKEVLENMKASTGLIDVVTGLSQNEGVSKRILRNEFGVTDFDTKELSGVTDTITKRTMRALTETQSERGVEKKYKDNPNLAEKLRKLFGHIVSEEFFKNIANKKNWGPAILAAGGLALFAMMAPGVLNITGDENEGK